MSTISQVVSSEYYSRTSLSRHISESVKAELYALYGGHRQCAITKSGMGPTWCHILPYTEELMHESLSQAKNLGLVHPDIHIYSESNLVPRKHLARINDCST
ncbi:hypothetical protein FRC02_012166 [Tulasnella sp. 418]|nr:hypothetical protein FRC02_012166 [Tulasnella sp. 418]